jgi:hypothetical protein
MTNQYKQKKGNNLFGYIELLYWPNQSPLLKKLKGTKKTG